MLYLLNIQCQYFLTICLWIIYNLLLAKNYWRSHSVYKNYILMDNFRGFSKTVVPFAKTNFLVGENSTGKSSVLSLVKIISGSEFWQKCELKCNETNLGHSQDVISVISEDKSYFRIGYLNDGKHDVKKEEENYISQLSFLIKYSNNHGIYTPKIITLFDNNAKNNYIINIQLMPKSFKVRFDQKLISKIENLEDANKQLIELIDLQEKSTGYNNLNMNFKELPDIRSVIFYAIHQLGEKIKLDPYSYLSFIGSNKKIKWVAPIRSKPRRTYDEPTEEFSPEGEHTPYLLKSLSTKRTNILSIIERVGKKSGLFKKIDFNKYGRNKNSPFELDVMLDNDLINIINVGYGVSQSIPIIAEIASSPPESWIIVQQPEVHLHPKAQAGIGEIIFESSNQWNHNLLIETHSDYMIDRFRILRRRESQSKKTEVNQFSSQILFFCRKDGQNLIFPIEIKINGDVSENQPDEYREFFIQEQLDIIGM